jgi:hypothetical protein
MTNVDRCWNIWVFVWVKTKSLTPVITVAVSSLYYSYLYYFLRNEINSSLAFCRGYVASRICDEKRKTANNLPPPQSNILVFFIFFTETLWSELLRFSFQPLKHHAIWIEDLFELSNNFDAPIHWRGWVMYFCSWCDSTDFRNPKVGARKKRATCVFIFCLKYVNTKFLNPVSFVQFNIPTG